MRVRLFVILPSASLVLLASCGAPEVHDLDSDTTSIDSAILADGIEGDAPSLCDQLSADRATLGDTIELGGVRYRVIQGTDGDDVLEGTSGPDVIFGGAGDDRIHGRGGTDIVCAGAGRDFVDGGLGQDRIYGGDGDDILHGGGAGDWIHGGRGDDEIYGDLLDDKLFGDEGDDVLVGSHGTDYMDGGPGNDWLRGDTGGDVFVGGAGYDVVSFMTARPTGRPTRNAPVVIEADLGTGLANGDGTNEPLIGIERVVGSAFADTLRGPGDLIGGFGADTCDGAPCSTGADVPLPFVYVDARPRDVGVIALGSAGNDHLVFRRTGGAVVITAQAPIHAGSHCIQSSATVVTCHPPAPFRYLLAWGGDGNDTLVMKPGFPRDFNAHLDGGNGNDTILGADGDDVLFTGRSGRDRLVGGPGEDALISESYAGDRRKNGAQYGGGGDVLLGGPGNDQLVSDYPCGRHFYSGGPGIDIAGFARVGDRSIDAQLRGPIHAADRSPFFGKAILEGVCDPDTFGTHLAADLEILEGSKGNDRLYGNDRRNIIWGRQGSDILRGFGGDDILMGDAGSDTIQDP